MSEKLSRPLRFTAKVLERLHGRPGTWERQRIGVFDGETQVGEYIYTYSSGLPFYAFEQDGQWFALMSTDYTAISIMTLPDCTIIGGETPDAFGFCPVELYVPAYTLHAVTHQHRAGVKVEPYTSTFKMHDDGDYDGSAENGSPWIYERFAFVAGCVWGDDSSWKLQIRDLSRVKEGLLPPIDIGYKEISWNDALREALVLTEGGFQLATQEYIRLTALD